MLIKLVISSPSLDVVMLHMCARLSWTIRTAFEKYIKCQLLQVVVSNIKLPRY